MAAPANGPQAGGLGAQILSQLRPEWKEQTHVKLRQVYNGYDGLPEASRLPLFFDHLFVTDIQTCGAGALPDVGSLAELRGDFLVQIDDMVDVSKPVKERLGEAGSNSHLFKLLLFDGHRVVPGLEHIHIPDLHAGIPRGCKALVRGPVAVFRGCLLLTPDSFMVLGGAVEELEAQRRSIVEFVSQLPVGRRGPRPALPEYLAQCRQAAVAGAAAGAGGAAAPPQAGGAAPPAHRQLAAPPQQPQPQQQQQHQQHNGPGGHHAQQPHHAQGGQQGLMAPPPQQQPPLPHHAQPTQAHGSGATQLPGSISFGSGRVAPAPGAAQPNGAPAAPAGPVIDGWDSDDVGWDSDEEDAPLNARGATQAARHSGGAPGAAAGAPAPAAPAQQPKPEPEVIDLAGDSEDAVPETEPQFEGHHGQQQQQQQAVPAGWAPPGDDDETQPLNGQPWPTGGAQTRQPAAVVETEPQEGPAAAAGAAAGGQGVNAAAAAAVEAAEDEIERFSQGRSPQRMISYTSGSSGKKRLRISGSRRTSASPLAGLKKVSPGAASVAPAAGTAAGAPSSMRPRPLGPALDQAAAVSPAGAVGPSRPPPRSPPHYQSPEAAAAAARRISGAGVARRGPLELGDDDLGAPPPPLAALRVVPLPGAHPAPSGAQNNAVAALTTPASVAVANAAANAAAAAVEGVEWGSVGLQPFTHVWALSRHVASAPPAAYPISATLCGTVAEMVRGGGGGGVRVVVEDATGAVTAAVAPALLLSLANAAGGRDGREGNPPPFESVEGFMAAAKNGAEGVALRRAVAATLLAHRGMMEVVVRVPGGEPELVQLLDSALTESQLEALRARAA